MPDSPSASRSGAARIAALTLVVAGVAGLVVAAFLPWFTVTSTLPAVAALAGFPSEVRAEVSGTGAVTMPELRGQDLSPLVPTDAAWAGWSVIGLAAAALVCAALAAFGPSGARRIAAAGTGVCGLAAAGVGAYALLVPTGEQTVAVQSFSIDVDTTADLGPSVTFASAVVVALGALAQFLARRSAAVPGPVFAPAPSNPVFVPPAPDPAWGRPARPAPSNPMPAPAHGVTAVAPVAQRRPRPEWDRNWPEAVPGPAPRVPSEQRTVVVKRPPRPVPVSPKPETQALTRQQPQRYDGPTQPL